MSTRLFPDIIVASELYRKFEYESAQNKDQVLMSIKDCLDHQQEYTKFGISNCFIGYEDWVWNYHDYEMYLKSFPDYFRMSGRPLDNFFYVYLVALKAGFEDKHITYAIKQKLMSHTYTPKVFNALGLYDPAKEK